MPTSVDLQNPFSYSFVLTVIFIVLAVLPAIILAVIKLMGIKLPKFKFKRKVKAVNPKPSKMNLDELKRKYLGQIDKIELDYKSNHIDDREAHIRMSAAVRGFVNERTGINVRNLSLREMEVLNMPQLYSLIKEFYAPEFAFGTDANDTAGSFTNAREVIAKWN